jgi:hypothetical protein
MPNLSKVGTSHNRTMKALIIYDKPASAAKASATLQSVAHRAEVRFEWNIKPWSVDVLSLASPADEALTEAADADLIVLTGRRAYSLPTWLEDWLECWATRRQIGDAALAAIHDRTDGKLSAPLLHKLSGFAARHYLSFIVNNHPGHEEEAMSNVRNLAVRKWPVLPALEPAMPAPSQGYYWHWGIND